MPVDPTAGARYLTPAQVAELLSISVDEVVALEEASLSDYLDDQVEEARRMALWNESNVASFPEVWGSRTARGD